MVGQHDTHHLFGFSFSHSLWLVGIISLLIGSQETVANTKLYGVSRDAGSQFRGIWEVNPDTWSTTRVLDQFTPWGGLAYVPSVDKLYGVSTDAGSQFRGIWEVNPDTWSMTRVLDQFTPWGGLEAIDSTGDYNFDGVVDAADYVVWRKNDGSPDGYNTWRANFGRTFGSGSSSNNPETSPAVPEPTSLVLLILAAIWVGTRRSRRRHLYCFENTTSLSY